MSLSELIRGSRLASLPKPRKLRSFLFNQHYPRNQVIKTTKSSLHRRDWGFKATLPPGQKSVYVSLETMDNVAGILQYESASGDAVRLERFRELGTPVKLPQNMDQDNFFQADSNRSLPLDLQDEKDLRKIYKKAAELSKAFRQKKLDAAKNTSFYDKKTATDVQDFMGLPKKVAGMQYEFNTAIGLNYSLPGSLFNTPKGFKEKKEVSGRLVNGLFNTSGALQTAAIGGFVTQTTAADGMTTTIDKPKFATPHKFIIQGNHVSGARVELRSTAVSVRSAKERPYAKSAFYRFY